MTKTNAIAQILRTAPRALLLLSLLALPLLAVDNVRANDENIIEGTIQKASGAGLVLMVSLQRAQ